MITDEAIEAANDFMTAALLGRGYLLDMNYHPLCLCLFRQSHRDAPVLACTINAYPPTPRETLYFLALSCMEFVGWRVVIHGDGISIVFPNGGEVVFGVARGEGVFGLPTPTTINWIKEGF